MAGCVAGCGEGWGDIGRSSKGVGGMKYICVHFTNREFSRLKKLKERARCGWKEFILELALDFEKELERNK